MQAGFVWLDEAVPGISGRQIRSEDNFTGAAVDGYAQNRLAGTVEMAAALAIAAKRAEKTGLRLLLWDAYRPQRAVDRFLAWCAARRTGRRSAGTTPTSKKPTSCRSAMWRRAPATAAGSAVDLTLARPDGVPLEMGGCFDLMDAISHHGAPWRKRRRETAAFAGHHGRKRLCALRKRVVALFAGAGAVPRDVFRFSAGVRHGKVFPRFFTFAAGKRGLTNG